MRLRVEPFGAWARLDSVPALVALDRDAVRRLGIDGGALWDGPEDAPETAPLEAHVAVTSRCGAGCKGCYLDATPDGAVPAFEDVVGRLEALARAGIFTVAFGGGEPLSREDLGALGAAARRLKLSPVVTTSGIGMTAERARELRVFEQVNVSYDGASEAYRSVRGFDGAKIAERAMSLLAAAAVPFGINLVLTRGTFDAVEESVARAVSLGAREVQLLRFKPAGRGTGTQYEAARLDEGQAREVVPLLARLSGAGNFRVRIDCAMVPYFSAHDVDPTLLARYGVYGCEAGRRLLAVTSDGSISPCSFAAPAAPFSERTVRGLHRSLPVLAFRGHADSPPAPCSTCALRSVCRGGCRIVASHAGSLSAPDPECPRVLAHRRGSLA
jgi:radical SAM protein with 4Fe4S-binding SPASM domain